MNLLTLKHTNMKKILFAAVAALAITSCSQNEEIDAPAQKTPVSFKGEFYQFNLSSCIRQQNSLTAQFVSFSLSNLANIFYPPNFYNN